MFCMIKNAQVEFRQDFLKITIINLAFCLLRNAVIDKFIDQNISSSLNHVNSIFRYIKWKPYEIYLFSYFFVDKISNTVGSLITIGYQGAWIEWAQAINYTKFSIRYTF